MIELLLLLTAPSVPPLEHTANWKFASKELRLTHEHRAMLAKNGFFVSPGGQDRLMNVYGQNDYGNLSSFITVDNVVDLFHVFFDSTLRGVEENHLRPSLQRLSKAMLKTSIRQWRGLPTTGLKQMALRNVAYFGVADRLNGGKAPIPAAALSMVKAELALIGSHSGFERSEIFPYQLDYSQFIVRGHYTRDAALGRYFQTMMWYGLAPFAFTEPNGATDWKRVQQAALVLKGINGSSAFKEWRKIYAATSLYAGESNDLSPASWIASAGKLLANEPDKALDNPKLLVKLFASAKAAFHAANIVNRTSGANPGDLQFRFMGQRAIPDSVVMAHLSNDMRPFPSPLDVGAVMGSKRAVEILDANPAEYNPMNWEGYVPARTKEMEAWQAKPASFWNSNLYNGELDALRKVMAPLPAAAPAFTHTSAWQDRCLSTALGGWAELRHDTLLYGEQSVAEMGGDDEAPPPFIKSYVEPNVPVYDRLIWLVNSLKSGLNRYGLVNKKQNDSDSERFKAFLGLLEFLKSVSQRELAGKKLKASEHDRLRKIEGDLSDLWYSIQISNSSYQLLNQDDQDMAVVADVHTAGSQVLEVAVGQADDLVAVVPIEGKYYVARGSVLSFYEFDVPISERMTDHAWKALLEDGKQKPRPSWINSYFVKVSSAR